MPKIRLHHIIITIVAVVFTITMGAPLLLIAFVGAYTLVLAPAPLHINLKTVDWAPGASNACYFHKAFWGTAAWEFDISPQDFTTLAKKEDWNLVEIGKAPIEISRYTRFARGANYPLPSPQNTESDVAVIAKGWHYRSKSKPNGGHILVAYDSDARRAYMCIHFR